MRKPAVPNLRSSPITGHMEMMLGQEQGPESWVRYLPLPEVHGKSVCPENEADPLRVLRDGWRSLENHTGVARMP